MIKGKQIIDKSTGNFWCSDIFSITPATKPQDLVAYFGEDNWEKSPPPHQIHSSYDVCRLKIADWYFGLGIYFESEKLTFISFSVCEKFSDISPYSLSEETFMKFTNDEGDYMTAWMAAQMDDPSVFKWDTSKPIYYEFTFPWGTTGVYWDPRSSFFSCVIRYSTSAQFVSHKPV